MLCVQLIKIKYCFCVWNNGIELDEMKMQFLSGSEFPACYRILNPLEYKVNRSMPLSDYKYVGQLIIVLICVWVILPAAHSCYVKKFRCDNPTSFYISSVY